MSVANRQNTLATWVSQGGQLWALGGGFGNTTNKAWNNVTNDVTDPDLPFRRRPRPT